MGRFLMQSAPGVDEWVLWSTGSDEPVACGDEAEMRRILRDMAIEDALATYDREVDQRFDRARERGSDSYMKNGWWEDEEIRFRNGEGYVPRSMVFPFTEGYLRLFQRREEPVLPTNVRNYLRPDPDREYDVTCGDEVFDE